MADSPALLEFKQGMKKLRDERPRDALVHFRAAADMEKNNPYYASFAGLSLARAEKQFTQAVKLCEMALSMKRNEPQLHLNLAEVYVAAGRRDEAVVVLDRASASLGGDARVRRARKRLGSRRPPVLRFLDRQHFLNRQLGALRQRVLDWADRPRMPLMNSPSKLTHS